jgi:hypothetical protein
MEDMEQRGENVARRAQSLSLFCERFAKMIKAGEITMQPELEALNATWIRAWFEKDDATVDRLMADDYVYVAPNGQTLDRAAILGIIRSPSYRIEHGARSEVIVRAIAHDAAILRHRWKGAGSFEGNPFHDDHRCVMVCARKGAVWQVVYEQCCSISP